MITDLARRAVWVLAIALLGSPLAAQSVRGTLVDIQSRPVAGAVVLLLDSTTHTVGRTLSGESGGFSFSSVGRGSYRLRVLRIGFLPFESDRMALDAGGVVHLQLPPTLIGLDTVRVAATSICRAAADQAATIYAVWDQVRTALAATEISTGDRALLATTIRSERWLDVSGRRVLRESSASVSRPVEQPWHSASGDVLHKSGYVDIGNDSITYRAPGLEALGSDEFIQDHCFRIQRAPGRVGIVFTPIPTRENLPEITGTAWVDSASAELRQLDFEYVHLAGLLSAQSAATVSFLRLRDGAWAISRWFIQMPYVAPAAVSGSVGFRVQALKVVRGDLSLVRREGDTLWAHPPLVLRGQVRDSATGEPIPEAEVGLNGTPLGALTDFDGRFAISGVLPGEYVANVRTPSLDSLNAGTQRRLVVGDSMPPVVIKALNARQTAAALCPRSALFGTQTAVVLGHVAAPSDSGATRNLRVLAQWSDDTVGLDSTARISMSKRRHWLETTTDDSRSFRLCGVPLGVEVQVRARLDSIVGPAAALHLAIVAPYSRLDLTLGGGRDAMFSGKVLADKTGLPIISAEVSLLDLNKTVTTNERGAFQISDVAPGAHHVAVRHIGFGTFDSTLAFGANQAVERAIVLPRADLLPSVTTTERGVIPSFDENKRLGLGQFKTRAELQQMDQAALATVLRDFRGLRIDYFVQQDTTKKGQAPTFMAGSAVYAMMTRGAEWCLCNVYLDGSPVYLGDRGMPPFDLSSIRVAEVEAIEFYRRVEEAPGRYGDGRSPCGVLVLWTRRTP